jgi:hypothetical protein
MHFVIQIKDLHELLDPEVQALYTRLSWPDSGSNSSLQKELRKRYVWASLDTHPPHTYVSRIDEPQPPMATALIWVEHVLVGWVGTRHWPETFKGRPVTAQTVECFVDPDYRRRGLAKLGLLSLIAAGKLKRDEIVSVYEPAVVALAQQCGCRVVTYCDP